MLHHGGTSCIGEEGEEGDEEMEEEVEDDATMDDEGDKPDTDVGLTRHPTFQGSTTQEGDAGRDSIEQPYLEPDGGRREGHVSSGRHCCLL